MTIQSTYQRPHAAIMQALRNHGPYDPFRAEWLLAECKRIDPMFTQTEIKFAELRCQIKKAGVFLQSGTPMMKGENWPTI